MAHWLTTEAMRLGATPYMGERMLTPDQITKLQSPLAKSRVKSRQQSGRAVSYIEGYDVIDTANDIFGFDGWSYEVKNIEPLGGDEKRRLYQAVVMVIIDGAVRSDVGHGISAGDSSEAQETAIKGAVTDALKRALRSFGAQFGNSLYDKDGPVLRSDHYCEAHGVELKKGSTGWGHVLEDKTVCMEVAA